MLYFTTHRYRDPIYSRYITHNHQLPSSLWCRRTDCCAALPKRKIHGRQYGRIHIFPEYTDVPSTDHIARDCSEVCKLTQNIYGTWKLSHTTHTTHTIFAINTTRIEYCYGSLELCYIYFAMIVQCFRVLLRMVSHMLNQYVCVYGLPSSSVCLLGNSLWFWVGVEIRFRAFVSCVFSSLVLKLPAALRNSRFRAEVLLLLLWRWGSFYWYVLCVKCAVSLGGVNHHLLWCVWCGVFENGFAERV